MTSDDLRALWGRVGVQVGEAASRLLERSKRTLVGNGSYEGFIAEALSLVPNAFYTARVTIDRGELSKLESLKIHTGMPVEVLINRGERTALQYILAPLSNNFAKAFKER